jgi:hypothetical protein
MQELKPVGFLYKLNGKADTTLVASNKVKNFEQFNTKWRKSAPVYILPDTHRIVPVELLRDVADQLSELSTFAAVSAIIYKEQTK